MKKFLAIILALALVLSLAACGGKAEDEVKTVGVAMPTQSSERWINDGGNMKKQLEALGYEVVLQYAEDDVQMQVSQIENMIAQGVDCLVIASIDGSALGTVLEEAKAAAGSDQERWVGKAAETPEEVKAELPQEMVITQEMRQDGYDRKTTTDDHGMHIYGVAKDQNGTNYFMVKNSWGETGKYKGIWYASDSFVRYKTLNIVVHKDALPKHIAKKLGIK